jgi:acyl-[acyl-carrier-protein] desaturase
MDAALKPESPQTQARIFRLFRDFFDRAEKKRRWNLCHDIPWHQCNPRLEATVADIIETFCAVELYLPDYLSKAVPQVRDCRGRAWMYATWGYEESKHSLVLEEWLLRSGHRSDEQMADLGRDVLAHEWNLPHDNSRGMVCYAMIQELATWLHYQKLRNLVGESADPALHRILTLVAIDERAHYDFFSRLVQIYLEDDREGTLEQLRRVLNSFNMPAVHMLAGSQRRAEQIRSLELFNENIFLLDVVEPCLARLGLTRADLRRRSSPRAIVAMGAGARRG